MGPAIEDEPAIPPRPPLPSLPPLPPRRVLIVSAAIGAGHDATGRALEDAVRRLWPDCDVRWLDVLDALGPGMAPLARTFYVVQIQSLPWLYDLFFWAIWRHRWYLASTRHVIAAWSGLRIERSVSDYGPDLILSTYPLGSAGLGWMRRNRGLNVPIGAWVSDFCPHPYWVYRDLDVTYVMHPQAIAVAERAEPGARVALGCLPVREAFQPTDRAAARGRLGLDDHRFIVLLATGSLGFGSVDRAVSALLAAGPEIQVIAACGRNERARRRLQSLGLPADRLQILGWTNAMPDWISAADVVTTNGGGVTAAEAIRCHRPIIMFDPIAGHGRANALLMAAAGLALLCPKPADLTAAAGRLARDPAAIAELVSAAQDGTCRRAEDDLLDLAVLPAGIAPAGQAAPDAAAPPDAALAAPAPAPAAPAPAPAAPAPAPAAPFPAAPAT